MSRRITLLLVLVACLITTATKTTTADITYGVYQLGFYEAIGEDYTDATDNMNAAVAVIEANLPYGDWIIGVAIDIQGMEGDIYKIKYYVIVGTDDGPPGA